MENLLLICMVVLVIAWIGRFWFLLSHSPQLFAKALGASALLFLIFVAIAGSLKGSLTAVAILLLVFIPGVTAVIGMIAVLIETRVLLNSNRESPIVALRSKFVPVIGATCTLALAIAYRIAFQNWYFIPPIGH